MQTTVNLCCRFPAKTHDLMFWKELCLELSLLDRRLTDRPADQRCLAEGESIKRTQQHNGKQDLKDPARISVTPYPAATDRSLPLRVPQAHPAPHPPKLPRVLAARDVVVCCHGPVSRMASECCYTRPFQLPSESSNCFLYNMCKGCMTRRLSQKQG